MNTTITLAQIEADRQANQAAQAAVNEAAKASTRDMLRAHIVAVADGFHLPYPQYRNHWDGQEWELMQATRQIRTKAGIAFEAGDWTVVQKPLWLSLGESTAYSIRNRCDTRIHVGDFRHRPAVVGLNCPCCDNAGWPPMLVTSSELAQADGWIECVGCGRPMIESAALPANLPSWSLRSFSDALRDNLAWNLDAKTAIFQSQRSAAAYKDAAPTWTVFYKLAKTANVTTEVTIAA